MEIAGIDADQIVASLMQIERRPLTQLTSRKDAASTASQALDRMRTNVDAFRLAAAKLADVSSFDRFAATVSASGVLSTSISPNASAGSLSLTVDRLAQAHGLRSLGTVTASSAPVTTATNIAVASGASRLGVQTVRSGAGLGIGTVELQVTQQSRPPSSAGTAALGDTSLADPSTIELTVNGTSHTVSLSGGTRTPAQLVADLDAVLAPIGARASLDLTGALSIATQREGSAATLQVTGGSALGSLSLAVDAAPRVGTDAKITANGVETTLASLDAGTTVSLDTGAGALDITLAGGLRLGTRDVEVVSTGDRSLAAVAAAINAAGAGVNAAAVRVGDAAFRLQVTSSATGEDGRLAIDPAAFTGALGGLIESSTAQNAQITIGAGAGAYTVESSGNTFRDLMTGVSITAESVSTTPVTVNVGRNDDAAATDVAALVSAANALLADIKVQTRYDAVNRTSGPLAGNSTIRRLADQVREAIGGFRDGLTPSSVGIQLSPRRELHLRSSSVHRGGHDGSCSGREVPRSRRDRHRSRAVRVGRREHDSWQL